MDKALQIGKLAKQAGVRTSLIRYYEERGLLPPAIRKSNGYRFYSPNDVERLRFIQRAKTLDFNLDEVKEILALRERGERPCDYVVNQIGDKIVEVERRIAALIRLKEELLQLQVQAAQLPPAADDEACVCRLIERGA